MVKHRALLICGSGFFAILVLAQTPEKPRVFVTDSQSWSISGSSGGSSSGFGGHVSGGARPQTAEIVKTFGERCAEVTVNNLKEKADYIVVLDHEGGKGWARKDNKVAVFNKDGDAIVSKSTRSLGNSVKDACDAVLADWSKKGTVINAAQKSPEKPSDNAVTAKASSPSKVAIVISPDQSGAEITIDSEFVGTSPSTIEVTPGEHTVQLKKAGYKVWERKLKVSGGTVNLAPVLEKE